MYGGFGDGAVDIEGDGPGDFVAAGHRDRLQADGVTRVSVGRLRVLTITGEVFEEGVGAVDLVAGGAETVADAAQVPAAGDGVLQQPGGLRLVRVGGGAGVAAQLPPEGIADASGAASQPPCPTNNDNGKMASFRGPSDDQNSASVT